MSKKFNKHRKQLAIANDAKAQRQEIVSVAPMKRYNSDGWTNILTGLGQAGRDKKVSGVFKMCRTWYQTELDELYRADGLARVVVDTVADEMVRQGWEVEGDEKDYISGQMDELHAYSKIADLIKWARLYGGGIIVMGINDGRELEEPVDINNIRDIKWLHSFDRYQASSANGMFEGDLNSPNYGFPDVYLVTDSRTGNVFYVHHSRTLRMDWQILPPRFQNWNDGWGDPIFASIYDELRNYSTLYGNLATMSYDFVTKVLKVDNLAQIVASDGCNTLQQRVSILNLAAGITNMSVIDTNESLEKYSTQLAGIADIVDRFMLALSAVSGIPVSLLFGRAPAGLNATGDNDVRNFYDRISQYQETKLKPILERFVSYLYLCKDSPLGGKEPDHWSISFVPLWQNTEEQEAIIRRTVAEADAIYLDRGVLDPSEVAISRFGGDSYNMNTIIDPETREKQDPAETEYLEAEKLKEKTAQPTIGPNYFGNANGGYREVLNGMDSGEYTEEDKKRERQLIKQLKLGI